jgi:hypothetical protein
MARPLSADCVALVALCVRQCVRASASKENRAVIPSGAPADAMAVAYPFTLKTGGELPGDIGEDALRHRRARRDRPPPDLWTAR